MKEEITNKLPTIDINDDSFFYIDNSINNEKIKKLIGKYIIFELKEENSKTILTGKLLEYNEKTNELYIRLHDDGQEETKNIWTDIDGKDLLLDFQEYININKIIGIEEHKKEDSLIINNTYINKICKLTNKHNKSITVLVKDINNYELTFNYKYKLNGKEIIETSYLPINLLKHIVAI